MTRYSRGAVCGRRRLRIAASLATVTCLLRALAACVGPRVTPPLALPPPGRAHDVEDAGGTGPLAVEVAANR